MSNVSNDSKSAPSAGHDVRAYSRRFHNIYLFITERCQLRCGHCYMGDRLETGNQMSFEKATQIIGYMHRLGAEFLTFVGGEPTLHNDLPRMVTFAHSIGYRKVMLDTNGLLVDRIQRIPPHELYYVRISLDGGSEETHDKVRGRGNFSKSIAAIKDLVNSGYTVRITTTLFNFNLHEVPLILQIADELGVTLVNFHSFSQEGYGVVNKDWSVVPEEWIEFYSSLERRKIAYRTEVRYPPTWAKPERLVDYVAKGFEGCLGCSLDRLSIFPDGRCYVCSLLFDTSLHFATMTDAGLVINRGENEYELFVNARLAVTNSSVMGCPVEQLLDSRSEPGPRNLVSVCRLWRTSAKVS